MQENRSTFAILGRLARFSGKQEVRRKLRESHKEDEDSQSKLCELLLHLNSQVQLFDYGACHSYRSPTPIG
ncbi:unnamed protein product [Onchocerca flexuosa]|uniref:Transposase n=1 Tax=Onchocerca flexuosa TaxID=387005 RepID=A0A183H033_9BILA|nr:unnamed protein product [Onchocerca flexuosa]